MTAPKKSTTAAKAPIKKSTVRAPTVAKKTAASSKGTGSGMTSRTGSAKGR